ncbi:MAG TPA: LLM class F420-dependent oxidoreductase [Acidimicrobiales bacterium]|nr:LLM class F420-dependent oxidoreductase [Acidimicrobiales bacterium]
MRHWTTYPLITHPYTPDLVTGGGLARFARAAEEAGFSGIAFTDHPAPPHTWLAAGGHDALDPFAALAYVAGVTERLRLIPNIVVLPYRNPFLVAKVAATLDALSGGRFVLSVATGYLRGEYRTLGVDFEQRNDLFDEALEAIRGTWSTDRFSFDGAHFRADAVTANPKPAHVPIWIGGNSARSRQRVARCADGWNPFPATRRLARTARTMPLESLDDLTPLVEHLHHLVEQAGRDPGGVDVAFTTCLPGPGHPGFRAEGHLEALDRMSAMGVTWNSISVPGDSVEHAVEVLQQYGDEVISRHR